MRYFANPCGEQVAQAMSSGALDCILTPKQYLPLPAGARYCADNGCFGKGWPGYDAWMRWLATLPPERCAFAVAPDVPGDAAATLARSAPWLPRICELELPAAFVGQDGLELLPVPWDSFDVLFLGGSTEWKLSAAARKLTAEAVLRGKAVHMGRVNSLKRMRYAAAIGCSSVDGTYLKFGPDVNLPRLLRFLAATNARWAPCSTY